MGEGAYDRLHASEVCAATVRSVSESAKLDELLEHLRVSAEMIESHPLPGVVPGSLERFVLDRGRPYVSQRLTKAERAIVEAAVEGYRLLHRRFDHRQCFGNSQGLLACDEARTLVYVEGFAWTHALIPTLHGWITIDGKVIDVTLPATTIGDTKKREPRQVLGDFTDRSYFGVPFLRSYVTRRRKVTGGWGTLIDDEAHEYPLLGSSGRGAVRRLGK
jgi:hypothetical protein